MSPKSPFSIADVALWLVGLVGYLAAALALFAIGEALGDARTGALLAIGVLVVLPVPLTRWFVRAYRRVDSKATFLGNASGIAALVGFGALAVMFAFARPTLARALDHTALAHPQADLAGGQRMRAFATWLRLRESTERPHELHATTPAALDAGATSSDAVDASALVEPVADRAHAADAGPVKPGRIAAASSLTIPICENATAFTVAAVPSRRGERDRVWVACQDYGQVITVGSDGGVRITARVSIVPPPGIPTSYVTSVAGADLDGDGVGDLVLGAHFLSERAGSRGGAIVWVRALADGALAEPVRLFEANCTGLVAADVDGRSGPELVVVDYGNPFAANTNGRLLVYSGRGARWRRVFGASIAQEPEYMTLTDADHDGALDVVIAHDLPAGRTSLVYRGLGSARFAPGDATIAATDPDRVLRVSADLDGDGDGTDSLAIVEHQTDEGTHLGNHGLRLERQAPMHAAQGAGDVQTLVYQAH